MDDIYNSQKEKVLQFPPKKRDLLHEVYHEGLSEDDACNIAEEIHGSKFVRKWAELLGMSRVEATADAHSIPYEVIAKWRYEGWPDRCCKCGRKIDVPNFGWFAKEIEEDQYGLYHVECLGNP